MRFSINSRVLEHLGSDLITSNEIALLEQIKNSFDARANNVNIHFVDDVRKIVENNLLAPMDQKIAELIGGLNLSSYSSIIIEDNGEGMDRQELEEGYFTIGTDIKKRAKNIKTLQRPLLGEKGIGRLASQRLGNVLIVETANADSDTGYVVLINWKELINKGDISKKDYEVININKKITNYTRLWIVDSVDFSDFIKQSGQLNLFEHDLLEPEFKSTLGFLISPFEFNYDKFRINVFLNDTPLTLNLENNAIKLAEQKHSFEVVVDKNKLIIQLKMQITPWYLERLHQTFVGRSIFKDWRKTPKEYNELLDKYRTRFDKALRYELIESELLTNHISTLELESIKQIAPINGVIYSFKRQQQLLKMAIESASENNIINHKMSNIKEYLEFNNGIKLYRGNTRIAKLGDRNNDWLELQQQRTKGQQFFRFELGNTIGYIRVTDPNQDFIKEISSRLDLQQNTHSTALKKLLKLIIHDYFYKFSQSAYYITRDIFEDEKLLPKENFEQLKDNVDQLTIAATESVENVTKLEEILTNVQETLPIDSLDNLNRIKKLINELLSHSTSLNEKVKFTAATVLKSKESLRKVEHERKLIELEHYNNYKLMANGLITEIITHELHSVVSNIKGEFDYQKHFKIIKDHFFKKLSDTQFYIDHIYPVYERFNFMNVRLIEINDIYNFLERTFLYKGTVDDFVVEDVNKFIRHLEKRMSSKLEKNKINIEFDTIDHFWRVPKGSLVHVFYNLIDNSIYWINRKRYEQQTQAQDVIRIEKLDNNTIVVSDSGIGVLPRVENTLFHPLESGKEKNGRGMGLYIVRQLLRSFDADIYLMPEENEYGRKYKFAIQLESESTEYIIEENI